MVNLAAGAMLAATPLAALAQDAEDSEAAAAAPAAQLDPETAALSQEIATLEGQDPARDPAGDLPKLIDLHARATANGKVPPLDMGLLASEIGGRHFYLRDYPEAARWYQRAGVWLEKGGASPEEMSGLYNNTATILAASGQYEEARATHEKALAIRMEMEGGRGAKTASSLFGIGYVLFRQGRVEESVPYFRESVVQQVEFAPPDDPNTVIRMTSLASVLGRSGREGEALSWARRAEAIGREYLGEDHQTYAVALNNLGNSLIENGLYQEALPILRQTLTVRRNTVGPDAPGTAISMRNLATVLKVTGQTEEAEALNADAITVLEASGDTETPDALPYMYADAAGFAAMRGDWPEYDRLAARAIALADAALGPDDHNRAMIHLYHARWLSERGQHAEALAIAQEWVPVMAAALIDTHPDRLWAEMLLQSLKARVDGAPDWAAADGALGRLEGKLTDLATPDRQLVREARTHRDAAMLYMDFALRSRDHARAVRAMQLVSMTDLALGQQFGGGDAAGGEADTAADADAFTARRVFLALSRKTDELALREASALEAGDEDLAAQIAQQRAASSDARDAARSALLAEHPGFVERYRPRPVELAELQARLGERDILLIPIEGERTGWMIRIERDRVSAHPFELAPMRGHVLAIREAVDPPGGGALPAFPRADALGLYRMLFPQGIKQDANVLLYGGQTLASVPFALMLTDDWDGPLADAPWLLRRASVQVVGNLGLLRREPAAMEAQVELPRFAGIGGVAFPDGPGNAAPDADGTMQLAGIFRSGRPEAELIADLPPLPEAPAELRAIASALGGQDELVLLGGDAAEENFKRADLSGYSVIAFATHGLVAGELRGLWEPALLLGTGEGSGEDGLLGASEIAQLRLDADLVILSACNTAAGLDGQAPVYSGLATSFAQAGARSLMLSHWRVRDDAAARLTVGTVEGMVSGLSRPDALRRAQLSLMADEGVPDAAHPAIWAPFVIIEN
ncbi:CHAT domain-containing tetratricopeptide repeat protein [Paraurantiacibacter namhicola]|uniref:CHAT domain protein n=1 Tax=Paraurantiacibacter namhicola TaxID=645517 RepID=A0A1C7D6M1_9SPHN|nr:CHAT domain-containing tetratricopeptide repeat protein [Paraurantiacibacter namhicola]ANU07002.1 CHAT domain protein [Paraurantiacibacter namhicola]